MLRSIHAVDGHVNPKYLYICLASHLSLVLLDIGCGSTEVSGVFLQNLTSMCFLWRNALICMKWIQRCGGCRSKVGERAGDEARGLDRRIADFFGERGPAPVDVSSRG